MPARGAREKSEKSACAGKSFEHARGSKREREGEGEGARARGLAGLERPAHEHLVSPFCRVRVCVCGRLAFSPPLAPSPCLLPLSASLSLCPQVFGGIYAGFNTWDPFAGLVAAMRFLLMSLAEVLACAQSWPS